MIKLIVSDIDGTLVKDGTLDINPEYMDVIRKLTEKGIHFVACSGRQYSSEKQLFAPVKDIISYISDGGTLIRTSEKILKVHTLSDEIWKNMARMAKKEMPGCDYFISSLSRLTLRLDAECTSTVEVAVSYDGGAWETVASLAAQGSRRSYDLPFVPRRCGSLRLRLRGKGQITLRGLVRTIAPAKGKLWEEDASWQA